MSDKIRGFFSQFDMKDLPTGGAVLVGIVLLFLMFKVGKKVTRLVLFIIAAGLFAGAWWWHQNK